MPTAEKMAFLSCQLGVLKIDFLMTASNDIHDDLAQLREENSRLKDLVRKHGIAY